VLPGLIDAAQAASPTLASARARIERARATLAASDAAALPRVDAVGSAQRARSVPEAPAAGSAALGVQAGWELDLFGGVAASQRASAQRLRGAEAGWHEARVSLAAETATAYVNLRGCEAQLQQAQADARSREATARLTDQSAAAGFTAPADAALARAGAAQARSQARAQQAQCDTLVKGLVELTDRPNPLRQQLAAATARLPQAGPGPAWRCRRSCCSSAPTSPPRAPPWRPPRPTWPPRADERPRVSFAGSLQLATLRSAGVSTNGSIWSIGPLQLSLPLFDGGSRRAATAAQQAAYDEAVAQLQASVRRALREVESALVALDSTAARERDVAAAAIDFEASLTATEARQRGGLASLLDLEAARRNACSRAAPSSSCSASALRPGSPSTAAWAAAGHRPSPCPPPGPEHPEPEPPPMNPPRSTAQEAFREAPGAGRGRAVAGRGRHHRAAGAWRRTTRPRPPPRRAHGSP
jgi:outer membrane protein, multidrug efflux system